MKEGSFIDPPSPFATLEEWEAFAAELRRVAGEDRDARRALREAERHIAALKQKGGAGSQFP